MNSLLSLKKVFIMNSILGFEVREIFDPVQSHAVYSVPTSRVDDVKAELKSKGASNFRVVKVKAIKGLSIVCFKMKK